MKVKAVEFPPSGPLHIYLLEGFAGFLVLPYAEEWQQKWLEYQGQNTDT